MPLKSKYSLVFEFFIAAAISLGTLLCFYPPTGMFFKWWEAHTVLIMLSFLMAGLLFFIFDFRKLMALSFGACAALCLLLDARLKTPLKNADQTSEHLVSIAQFSLDNTDAASLDEELATILDTKADVLSIQEIPYDLRSYVHEIITCFGYPYYQEIVDSTRSVAMSVFSRHAFEFVRKIEAPQAPSIAGKVKLPMRNGEDYEFYFFNSCIYLPDSEETYARNTENLMLFSEELQRIQAPLFVFGDYHMVSWSRDLQVFRQHTRLNDSRRGIMPTSPHGYFSIFDQPLDHIFYSNHFECINFETISSASTLHLGIVGTYQFGDEERKNDVKQTSQ